MTIASSEATSADPVVAPSLYRLRLLRPADEAFVRDSWRRAYERLEGPRWPTLAEYIASQNAIMSHVLPRCAVTIACSDEDDDQIFGWVAGKRFADVKDREIAVVHFLYVKRCFAAPEFGIEQALWRAATDGAKLVYSTQWAGDIDHYPRITHPWMVFA